MHSLDLNERAVGLSKDSSTSYKLEFPRVEPRQRWQVDVLAYRNNTTAPSRIDIYKQGHGYNHYLGQTRPGVGGYIYLFDRTFWVAEGETLTLEFFGGGATDDMEAWVTGLKWVLSQGGSSP